MQLILQVQFYQQIYFFIIRILKTSYLAVSAGEYIEINNIQHLYKTLLIASKINKTRTRNNRRY